MKIYGLIGKNIAYSFSRHYFSEKFEKEQIPAVYQNFDLDPIEEFTTVLADNPGILGLNVTIPYKEEIIPYLDGLDPVAQEIGAVNTIKVEANGKLTGYNTDHHGFLESLKPHLSPQHTHALILGTGGASKAIAYGLKQLGIAFKFVSRTPKPGQLSYTGLTPEVMERYKLIINTTPLGTSPNVTSYPPVPVQYFTSQHFIYDLIYNPAETMLMKLGSEKNAKVFNGRKMLELQAEKAWETWTSNS